MRLGSDPEVFLNDQKGNFVSVIGMVGAGKENPLQVDGMAKGFTFQEDNVALEFGIPPASSAEEFVAHIQNVQQAFLNRYPGFTFSKLSCTIFPEEQMNTPLAFMFGCEPDFNAWTGKINKKPEPPHPHMRSAGGHVHVETKLPARKAMQAMDLMLGTPSTLMDDGSARRQLYGKMGAYRPKPYGGEYRVLSNYWMFDDKLIRWVWGQTEKALQMVEQGFDFTPLKGRIEQAINNSDAKMAQSLVDEFGIETL